MVIVSGNLPTERGNGDRFRSLFRSATFIMLMLTGLLRLVEPSFVTMRATILVKGRTQTFPLSISNSPSWYEEGPTQRNFCIAKDGGISYRFWLVMPQINARTGNTWISSSFPGKGIGHCVYG